MVEPQIQRQLSSRLTFFYKFIFTGIWITGFGIGTLVLIFGHPMVRGGEDLAHLRAIFVVVWLGGSFLLLWSLAPLKRVILSGDRLLVSNFRREESAFLHDVESVKGSILMSPEMVWISLRRPGMFGSKVKFMAPARLFPGFSRHPIVAEIETLVAKSQGRQSRAAI